MYIGRYINIILEYERDPSVWRIDIPFVNRNEQDEF